MKSHPAFFNAAAARALALAPLLLLAALLHACGGGDGLLAGVGSGGSGLASGIVSGFGSVYVDGVEIEDAQSSNIVENADGTTTTVALKLGQGVRVRQDSLGAASQVTVEALVSGSVSAVNTGQLTVAGQPVAVNSHATAWPLTVFGGGYLALADVQVGDTVEVHGSVQSAAQTAPGAPAGGYTFLATRIEKLAATRAVRVMGTVARLNTVDGSFALNGLTVRHAGVTLVPATATLAEGSAVTVWGTAATQNASNPTLQASRIRVGNPAITGAAVGGAVQASGLVSALEALDSASHGFMVQGLRVNASAASVTPAGAALANAAYVRVSGVLAADGSVTARSVQVQQADGGGTARVRLAGTIGSFLNTTSFVVRDVPVDASAINIAAACPGQVLGSGVFVDITAQLQAGTDVVKALSLSCPHADALPPYAMREYQGTATSVATASRSFTVMQAAGGAQGAQMTQITQVVQWTQQTAFKGITAATLAGTCVIVEGYLDGTGTLVAREIRTFGQSDADRFDPRQGDGDREWSRYDDGFRPTPPGGPPRH